jgi:hypothetical protein
MSRAAAPAPEPLPEPLPGRRPGRAGEERPARRGPTLARGGAAGRRREMRGKFDIRVRSEGRNPWLHAGY